MKLLSLIMKRHLYLELLNPKHDTQLLWRIENFAMLEKSSFALVLVRVPELQQFTSIVLYKKAKQAVAQPLGVQD